jgi:hypothetical protein
LSIEHIAEFDAMVIVRRSDALKTQPGQITEVTRQ